MAKPDVKLGIGIPLTDDKVHSQFLDSWVLMERPAFTYLRPDHRGPIAEVRNLLVLEALKSNCTHVIMMDTDQEYPYNTITKLLSHDLDAVGALVYRRYPPFDPVMLRSNDKGGFIKVPEEEMFSGELIEVEATGCGCVMFNTQVFETVPYPWFEFMPAEGPTADMGEDIGFCIKLRNAGYQVFVDTAIEVEHLALMSVNRAAYEIYKVAMGKRTDLEAKTDE